MYLRTPCPAARTVQAQACSPIAACTPTGCTTSRRVLPAAARSHVPHRARSLLTCRPRVACRTAINSTEYTDVGTPEAPAAPLPAEPAHLEATTGAASAAVAAAAAAAAAAQLVESDRAAASSPESDASGASSSGRKLINRIVFGVLLGTVGGAVILYGKLTFLVLVLLVVYQATQEYYGFLTSKGISKGATPPPPLVSTLTTVLCISISVMTWFLKGKSGSALAIAAFLLLSVNVLAIKKPTFATLSSSLFGLFYCGYLPSFWLKLRLMYAPGPELPAMAMSPYLPDITVGLLATFTTVACIIAADTGAFFVGKNLGRTKLTDISPRKTVEGALGGLVSAVGVALLVYRFTSWPGSAAAACGLGVLTFFSSLFGDLIESIMKRDAEMKDSGDLIPGHGGLLDRFDSYIFSGATTWFYLLLLLPKYGLG